MGHSSYTTSFLSSLVNVLGANQFSEDVVPTVAFNLRQVRKGNVVMKIWDVAVSPMDYSASEAKADRFLLVG